MPEITVVVPARNASATIGRTLAALAAQRVDADYEVIVVDSGSTDDTPAIVSESRPAGVLLRNPGGEPAGSRNMGAAHGTGRVLAFTDADCEPAPGWLASGLSALERADLVQGKVAPIREPGPFDRTVVVNNEYGLYETANLFVRRELFERIGGFEPLGRARQPFGEDVWFAWRAKRIGARSAFAEDALVHHAVFPRGFAGFLAEKARARYFPPLIALVPELREQFLTRRVFLSPQSARFDFALAGILPTLLTRRPYGLALTLPYLSGIVAKARRQPPRRRPLLAWIAADAVTCLALVRGSVSARTLVL